MTSISCRYLPYSVSLPLATTAYSISQMQTKANSCRIIYDFQLKKVHHPQIHTIDDYKMRFDTTTQKGHATSKDSRNRNHVLSCAENAFNQLTVCAVVESSWCLLGELDFSARTFGYVQYRIYQISRSAL